MWPGEQQVLVDAISQARGGLSYIEWNRQVCPQPKPIVVDVKQNTFVAGALQNHVTAAIFRTK